MLAACRAIPQAHSVAQLMNHVPLQGLRINCGEIKIDPGCCQQTMLITLEWIEKRIVLPIPLEHFAPRYRQTTITSLRVINLTGIGKLNPCPRLCG